MLDTTEKQVVMTELGQEALRQLLGVWFEFEKNLNKVPIVRRLMQGTLTAEDYRKWILHWRPQVIEGSRWISRAASSFNRDFSDIRSLIIGHAAEEHRDYQLLESDFLKMNGELNQITDQIRNPGTEALHAYMMYQAGLENPFNLIGAMWIIEGLGHKMAKEWASQIEDLIPEAQQATQFLRYHGENDDAHMQKLYTMINRVCVDEKTVQSIITTARVVGRLYVLQLEEVDYEEH